MQRPEISTVLVVVPAHDEERHITPCLTSVLRAQDRARQELAGLTVTVTVVLDRCTDTTLEQVRSRGRVAVVPVSAGSVGVARAAGVRAAVDRLGPTDAASVLVVNTDADCRVPVTWLLEHVRLAASYDVVLGEVLPDPAEMGPAALALWWERHPVGRGSLHGANLSVRLSAYLAAGGFPAVARQEDLLLVRALRARGAAVVGGTRVHTSARRVGRVPDGFAAYLRGLDADLARRPGSVPVTGAGA